METRVRPELTLHAKKCDNCGTMEFEFVPFVDEIERHLYEDHLCEGCHT